MISFRLRFRAYQLRAWHEAPRRGAVPARFARSVLQELLAEPHQAREAARFLREMGRRVDADGDPSRTARALLRELELQTIALEEEPLPQLVLPAARREEREERAPEPVRELAYVAVEIVDGDGLPVPHVLVEIELPNGQTRRARANESGFVQLDGVPPGNCKVRLPHWDQSSWRMG